MNIDKENVYSEFVRMIEQSWTFSRMEEAEQRDCYKALHDVLLHGWLHGNARARWHTMQVVYNAFLLGIGYDGGNWRNTEEEKEDETF